MTMRPWWETIRLRDEVASGAGQIDDVQMSLFNALRGTVPYKDVGYYGEITHPTADLVNLMGKIAVRLGVGGKGSEQAKAVWRLDQGMGGGKSHGLVGMWHLATAHRGIHGNGDRRQGDAVRTDSRRLVDGRRRPPGSNMRSAQLRQHDARKRLTLRSTGLR